RRLARALARRGTGTVHFRPNLERLIVIIGSLAALCACQVSQPSLFGTPAHSRALASGRVIQVVREAKFSDSEGGTCLDFGYLSDHYHDDDALEIEIGEIWASLLPEAERSALKSVRITAYEILNPATLTFHGKPFELVRQAPGDWSAKYFRYRPPAGTH